MSKSGLYSTVGLFDLLEQKGLLIKVFFPG